MTRRLFALFVPFIGAACGGAPVAPQAPASSGAPAAGPPVALAPDLGAVAPPAGLVVSGQLPHLEASLGTVHGWTQLPMPQSEQITAIIADDALGALVALDQPIDFAVAVVGAGARLTTMVAVSAAVRDLEQAKTSLSEKHKLTPGDNGALLIHGLGHSPRRADDADDDGRDGDDGHACELAPAFGAATTRLVCAWDPKALAALGPWLTRGATRQTSTYDAHVDVRMQPLKPTIMAEKRLFSLLLGTVLGGRLGLSGARDLTQAIGADVADFANDLDTLSLDVALSDPGAAATMTLKLSGPSSAIGRLALANADRNGPPPAAFWQMPGDADFAFFDRGIDANDLAHGRDLALKVVTDRLAEDGLKDADSHAIADALGKILTPAPMVFASGIDADAARKALAAEKALGPAADPTARRDASRASAQALLGWRVVEIDEAATVRVDAMKGLALAFARPGVDAAYRAKGGGPAPKVVAARMPKEGTLPKDAQHFEIDLPLPEPAASSAGKGKPHAAGSSKPLAIDVFIVPDGTRSWIGMGDGTLVVSKLSAAIVGSGDTLRARPELGVLKDASLGAAGFFTGRGVPELGEQMAAIFGGDPGRGAELFETTAQLPHQGVTPVPFTLTAQSGAAGTVVATMQVSRGTVDDVLVTVLKHGF